MRKSDFGPYAALLGVQLFFGSLAVIGKVVLAVVPALALVGFRVAITALLFTFYLLFLDVHTRKLLIEAKPGDTIEVGEGRFDFTDGLSLTVDGVTIKGAGQDKTFISFAQGTILVVAIAILASLTVLPACASGWSTAPAMVTPLREHTTTVLNNGKVLVTGGYNGSAYVATSELYDPASNSWTSVAAMTVARGPLAEVRDASKKGLLGGLFRRKG